MNAIERQIVPGEMETLYSGFNQLMDTVNDLLQRVYEEELAKANINSDSSRRKSNRISFITPWKPSKP